MNEAQKTQHPSGVEAIDLCRHLPFALGTAVEHLFRMHLKGNREKDLRKAAYYFADYLVTIDSTASGYPPRSWLRLNDSERADLYTSKARQVVLHEPDPVAGRVFGSFLLDPLNASGVQFALDIVSLELLKMDEERAAQAEEAERRQQ